MLMVILQVLQTSSSAHTHLGVLPYASATTTPQRPVTPRQHQVVSIRDNPCFDENTTNIVNKSTLPNDVVETTTGNIIFRIFSFFFDIYFIWKPNLVSYHRKNSICMTTKDTMNFQQHTLHIML